MVSEPSPLVARVMFLLARGEVADSGYRDVAEAVVREVKAAMREPSAAMHYAGSDAMRAEGGTREVWQAMLDAWADEQRPKAPG